MSRVQGYLITMTGCLLALMAFCFLPYLTTSTTEGSQVTFTGWQLLTSGSQIQLPDHELLQNVPNLWVLPVLSVLVLLTTCIAFWQDRAETGDNQPQRGCVPAIALTLCLMLFLFLCSWTNVAGPGWPDHTMPRNATIGVLVPWGYDGLLVSMVLALLGSVIAWRAKK